MTDEILIQQARKGNEVAFSQLVERHKDYVFSLCVRTLKNRANAEEVAQEIFIKMFRKLSSFKGDAKFTTWLYTIAYRACLDFIRRNKAKSYSLDSEDSSLQISAVGENPQEKMEANELTAILKEQLDKMKPQDASLISLFYFKEKNVKEVAEIMNLSESNVKVKIHRLREKMRVTLVEGYGSSIRNWMQ
ncbi:sigma-70 family RNA polymerase sigma factor [Chitinophagales bacterium]|nr:sigma-70 family RNA polymerase sigma factor [Chitinophagales bacterium]